MIYLLYGNDVHTSRKKLHRLLDGLFKKRPDAEYFHVTPENISEFSIEELISSQGLFEHKYIVVLDNLFEDKEQRDVILKVLKEMQKAEHVFIFLEEKLDKKTITKFEKYAEKIQEFTKVESGGRKFGVVGGGELDLEKFNIFNMTDALGNKNKKSLWVLYQKAKRHNIPAEEIHGILFWQVKSMLLTLRSGNAKEAGLNPFVFNKSKGFLKNYSSKEMQSLSQELIELSHDARRGIHEFDTALERFILAL